MMGFGKTRKERTRHSALQTRVNALVCLYPSYERALFDALTDNQVGKRVWLEQERILFGRLQGVLEKMPAAP